ncbi:MAG TPA: hypothetical protein VGM43_00050, partial [Bryobacteraceae bacterium]
QQRAMAQSRIRMNNPQRVHVNVGEMEFRGFDRSSAFRAADQFQGELASLIARNGVPSHWLAAGTMDDLRVYAADSSLASALAGAGKEPVR